MEDLIWVQQKVSRRVSKVNVIVFWSFCKMNGKLLCIVALLTVLLVLQQPTESKKVIVHVPYRVKKLKHTHTVYVVIPHYDQKEDSKEDDKLEI